MIPYFKHFYMEKNSLPHISPLMGGVQQCKKDYTYGPVMRRYYIIEYVLNGCGEYTVNGQVFKVKKGEAFVIRPYEAHLLRADKSDPLEYVWIGFSTDLAIPKPLAEHYVFDGAPIADIFLRLADTSHRRSCAEYATMIYGIFARLYSLQDITSKQSNDPIDEAVDIIRKEYATITVGELARRLYMNRSYFGARFRQRIGRSPKQYIDETRLSTAAMMISELGYTVTQAALATGYSDIMSFSRAYKKHFGISPRQSVSKRSDGGGTIILK